MTARTALGPDRFMVIFFNAFWDLVNEEVWKIVENSRKLQHILHVLNAIFLTVIPKMGEAYSPYQFRQISLCNVIYKTVTKVIANCLKHILAFIISLEQFGFFEGLQIMDGIILTHNIFHSLRTTGKPRMMLKLDIAKSYDKLNWKYLKGFLKSYSFRDVLIQWFINLVFSSFLSIHINGAHS